MNRKHQLRRLLIEKRLFVSVQRRNEARQKLLKELLPKLEGFSFVLSFASKQEEIDLWPLNEHLAHQKRLVLPRIEDSEIVPYSVHDIHHDLEETGHWKILEPASCHCQKIPLKKLGCVLVPGLGFDSKHHRLGYGKGYFDRFLKQVSCPVFGVGFNEQRLEELIPVEPHDVPLTKVYLF